MDTITTYRGFVTELSANQIFVFGSNLHGYHAGGAAGFASYGKPKHNENYFDLEDGWIGYWNVKGKGIGYQEGTNGCSYALPTVNVIFQSGEMLSNAIVPIHKTEIKVHILYLYEFAKNNPDMEFLIGYRNDGGVLISGFTIEEMAEMFSSHSIPNNIVFEESFALLVNR